MAQETEIDVVLACADEQEINLIAPPFRFLQDLNRAAMVGWVVLPIGYEDDDRTLLCTKLWLLAEPEEATKEPAPASAGSQPKCWRFRSST